MRIDPATLGVVALAATSLTGLLLLFAWRQIPDATALGWWSGALLTTALAIGLLTIRFVGSDAVPVAPICVAMCLGAAMIWAGCRAFERRSTPVGLIVIGAVVWLAACGIPGVYKSSGMSLAVACGLCGLYASAASFELLRGSRERLGSRIPAAALLAVHALMLASAVPDAIVAGDLHGVAFGRINLHAIEALVFAIAMPFLFVGLAWERGGLAGAANQEFDPDTASLTRDAFMARGRAMLDVARTEAHPCVVLHARIEPGWRDAETAEASAIAIFCAAARTTLPVGALIGRLGEDEIGCLLGAPDAAAWNLAEKVRRSFERTCLAADPDGEGAGVAIGIATTEDAGHVLHALLATADLALIVANAGAGNRVARLDSPDLDSSALPARADLIPAIG